VLPTPEEPAPIEPAPIEPAPIEPAPLEVGAPIVLPPDWIQDIRRKYTLRITDWISQSWALTRSPYVFMEEWSTGTRETLNPLRFFAVGATITFLSSRAARSLMHIAPLPDSGWRGFAGSYGGQLLLNALMASLMHVVLRFRSHAPLRSTLAASAFASSGPSTLLLLVGWIVSLAIYVARGRVALVDSGGTPWPWPVLVVTIASFGWTFAILAGAHRVRWWWSVIAIVGALVMLMLLTILGVLVWAAVTP